MENIEYKVHLLKPQTDLAKANSKIIISMVLIWAVAVFGFQILLKVLEKPTKEKSLIAFEQVWGNVSAGNATTEEKQTLSKSLLAVLGKTVKKDHRATLVDVLNWSIYSLAEDVSKDNAAQQLGVSPESLEAKLMAIELSESRVEQLDSTSQDKLPGIMNLYLIHNQSVLTDTKFLGFPFHYWYTAEFLLILFVLLCLVYCILIVRVHRKYNVEDR